MTEHTRMTGIGRTIVRLGLLAATVGAAAAVWYGYRAPSVADRAPTHAADNAVPVLATTATLADVPVWLDAIGTVSAIGMVDAKVRVDGQLQSVAFAEGDEIRAGQVLAQIDPRPYLAAVAQATAALHRDDAQYDNIAIEVERANRLATAGAGTAQNLAALKAQLAGLKAALEADRAALDAAQLNLDFTRVEAPISGRAGLRQINPGSIVHASDATGVVTLTQMSPISVLFALPQDNLDAVLAAQRAGRVAVGATTRDGGQRLDDGELVFVNSTVDPGSGQIQMRAVFANAERRLWPGAFVQVRLHLRTDKDVVTIPSQAVQTGEDGLFVYVIQPDGKVAVRPVSIGPSIDGTTEIRSGLAAGTRVVLDGQSRLAPGRRVTIDAR